MSKAVETKQETNEGVRLHGGAVSNQGLPIAGGGRKPATYEVICGDAREAVLALPEVHGIVTSPPYFGKRTYGQSEAEVGQEAEVDPYVDALVEVLSSVPLHPRASIWVNIGDKRGDKGGLLDIPHRFTRAMCQAGYLLADHVIWAKAVVLQDGTTVGGLMPEPAPGRLNGNGFEEMFRFVRTRKVSDAWTDTCAVAIPRSNVEDMRYLPKELMSCHTSLEGRRPPNVWQVPMGQTRQNHFGVFPASLVERCIAMTCPAWVNADASLPERIVEMVPYVEGRGTDRYLGKRSLVAADDEGEMREMCGRNDTGQTYVPHKPVTLGWTDCDPTGQPGIVLDPFAGTGTTGEDALKLGRSFIGIDLYDEYCQIARRRCEETMRFLDVDLPP
jgi:hypothetical protein